MSITPAQMKTRFPAFSTLDDDYIQLFIDEAALVLNSDNWGDLSDLGLMYYTAHLIAIDQRIQSSVGGGAAINPIASKSVDGVSISYSVNQPSKSDSAWLMSTAYGQRYLELRRSLGSAITI